MNSVACLPPSKRLLEQVSEVIFYKHYSVNIEQTDMCWVRFYRRSHMALGQHLCEERLPRAVKLASSAAPIVKPGSVHSLLNGFATRLLQSAHCGLRRQV